MKVLHLRTKKAHDTWQITDENQPDWVKKAFADGGFKQNGQRLQIVNTYGLTKISVSKDEVIIFNGKYAKIVPKAKFEREYKAL
ncbi:MULTISPECIES: hypothetical protein [unclassified Lactococcus]|uniref:hypothetical protein n=1 Tax=unclassified Lactococcus TaxID=2643510 RepID=UPI0011CC86E7|nr:MULTISPECIES: hypothetical protein [unclassified Lactococcus]MQW22804.1 hypothetical protein [Lactococcus sp. dk101]TXK44808.1 hypothetical protein FVP42_04195 [Lactococcus sp. dk310]TXK50702.1 hypothetical protein FVP43_04195 [Lactococcus sp. dk322]